MGEALEHFIGKQVKVVFKDGDKLRVKHGVLISVSDGFATLETMHGTCAIKIAEIIKIQTTPSAGDGYERKHR